MTKPRFGAAVGVLLIIVPFIAVSICAMDSSIQSGFNTDAPIVLPYVTRLPGLVH